MMKKKIGMLYLCTGPYSLFWEDYYKSFEKYFLEDIEKHYFVFTDNVDSINTFGSDRVNVIHIDPLPWPLITLLRFNYFLSIEDQIKNMDYLMFSNANVVCCTKIMPEEFLPRDEKAETMFFVRHPGHCKGMKYNFPYDRQRKSKAYIPYNCGKDYVIGAMFGGKTQNFLKMCHTCKERIEDDLKHNIIAKWHDESHMNRYIVGHSEFRILHPGYCYPVGFDLPVEKKIAGVSKMAKFNVQMFKGTTETQKGIKLFMKRAIRRIKKEGVFWYFRDAILVKRIKKI